MHRGSRGAVATSFSNFLQNQKTKAESPSGGSQKRQQLVIKSQFSHNPSLLVEEECKPAEVAVEDDAAKDTAEEANVLSLQQLQKALSCLESVKARHSSEHLETPSTLTDTVFSSSEATANSPDPPESTESARELDVLQRDTPKLMPVLRIPLAEYLDDAVIRKSLFHFLPLEVLACCRSTQLLLRKWVAELVPSIFPLPKSELSDVIASPALVSNNEVVTASTLSSMPAASTAGFSPKPDSSSFQLRNISDAFVVSPKISGKMKGEFQSNVAARTEAVRDFARVMIAPAAQQRLFLVAGHPRMQPVRLSTLYTEGNGNTHNAAWVQVALRDDLDEQLRTALGGEALSAQALLRLCDNIVLAMSASIGVDFAVKVGLMPVLLQPAFVLAIFGGPPLQAEFEARLMICGFVTSSDSDVSGDRPDSKRTPWCAALVSPNLLDAPSESGHAWEWEYSIRSVAGDTVLDAAAADLHHLEDAVAAGCWTGLL